MTSAGRAIYSRERAAKILAAFGVSLFVSALKYLGISFVNLFIKSFLF